jgi:aspartate racemase
MKKIGIVGGLGPVSTVEYYKGIIAAFHESYDETGYPEIALESCNLKEMLSYSNSDNWQRLAERITDKFELLRKSGCDFGVIAANTPHKVFDDIRKNTSLPLLSIIEATCDFAAKNGYKKLCLLGTGFTMKSNFYQEVFNRANIELVVPPVADIEYIHEKIFSELELGIVIENTRKRFIQITNQVIKDNNCEGAIMGCTELPLILKAKDIHGAYIDTTAIHIEKIVTYCRQN